MGEGLNAEIPSLESCRLMWEQVAFTPHSTIYPNASKYVSALSEVYANGKVLHRSFSLPRHPVYDWYASRNRYHEMNFFERFWSTRAVLTAIPLQPHSLNFYSPTVFEWSSPFMLAGSLAWTLAGGGPYKSHLGGSIDAKRIADAAAEELIIDDYDSALLFTSHVAWSDFFCAVAWDYTWILIRPHQHIIHVILATDTD